MTAAVTVGTITYHRRDNGAWFQACGVEMPRRDWRWLDEIERLTIDLEWTRQCWVDRDDPLCEDVCVIACKGVCGVKP
jgi:hypothetical protein